LIFFSNLQMMVGAKWCNYYKIIVAIGCTTPKHVFHDHDTLWLLSNYSHVVIFGFKLLSFFLLQPLLGPHDYKYDYR
jgi:hypothetical protein